MCIQLFLSDKRKAQYLFERMMVIILTKAIENFINCNRLSITINVFGNGWAIFCLFCPIYISELYKYVFCFILIHNLKSDLEGSGSNPMSHAYCVARQFSGKHTSAFWKGPGFKSGTGHGGGGYMTVTHVKKNHMTRWGLEPGTYRRPCKYSDHLANGPHGEPANSTIYTAG